MLWSVGQFPELEHLEPAERSAVLALVPWWTYPLMVARATFRSFLGSAFFFLAFASMGVGQVQALIASGTILAIGATGFYLMDVRRIRMSMRTELAKRFHGQRPPFCMNCGYDLRESRGDGCPECGVKAG